MSWVDIVDSLVDALETGLPYAVGYLGVWLLFRVMRDFDLTVDGTFVTGAAVAALWIAHGHNPWAATLMAFAAGAAGGLVTFVVYRYVGMPLILTSIIVGVGLFSVNLKVLGVPNLNLVDLSTVTSEWSGWWGADSSNQFVLIALFALVFVVVAGALTYFLSSQSGLGLRATGINPDMARAQGVATASAMCAALVIGNGLMGLSGALVAQDQGYVDVNMGVGTILFGVTSVLLGEVVLRRQSPLHGVLAVLIGTVVYRFLLAMALRAGIDPDLYQGLTAIIVVLAVGVGAVTRSSNTSRLVKAARARSHFTEEHTHGRTPS